VDQIWERHGKDTLTLYKFVLGFRQTGTFQMTAKQGPWESKCASKHCHKIYGRDRSNV